MVCAEAWIFPVFVIWPFGFVGDCDDGDVALQTGIELSEAGSGERCGIVVKGNGVMIDAAGVPAVDIEAGNGVNYMIDGVTMPPSVMKKH